MLRTFAVVLLAAVPALAQESAGEDQRETKVTARDAFQRVDEYEPKPGTPLISNKLYPMQFKLEFTGFFDYSFNDKYVEHLGGSGAFVFHVFDWLAFEGFGGYLLGDETGIVGNVRLDGASAKRDLDNQACFEAAAGTKGRCEPQLPDMWMTTWFAGGDVQWAPIYGKLSAVSEYDLNFQLYGVLGGGVEGITRKLNTGAQDFDDPQVRVSANYGLGVRLIPWKYVAQRAEIRNYNGLNPNVGEHDPRDEDACDNGYTLVVGRERQCFPDISNNTMLQIGISLLL
jgi:outer membrane beta-barrel protein